MMKIGLLSLHKNTNYGWVLQCYALLSILKSLGQSTRDIVEFYNKRGGKERIFDDMNNGFG